MDSKKSWPREKCSLHTFQKTRVGVNLFSYFATTVNIYYLRYQPLINADSSVNGKWREYRRF